jgi:hypothetical protein
MLEKEGFIMLVGLNINATREYVSKLDPDKGTAKETVFTLGTLDTYVMGRVRDKLTTIESVTFAGTDAVPATQLQIHASRIEACRFGIRGWKNLVDENGKEIEFKTDTITVGFKRYEVVKEDLLKIIPLDVLLELADVILKDNTVTEKEVGNSESA